MMSVIEEVAAERQRQQAKENWSPEHDDSHKDGSLGLVAALYATPIPLHKVRVDPDAVIWTDPWPWKTRHVYHRYGDGDPVYYTPDGDKRKAHPRRHQLVIAAALLVAEIERLDRAAAADH